MRRKLRTFRNSTAHTLQTLSAMRRRPAKLMRAWYTPALDWKLLIVLVVFRLLNALLLRTSFTPDEFWQGPEPAHLLAYGKGHLTWEWEASARIRGFTHPIIFAAVYKVLQWVSLDTRWAVAHSPKLLQGMSAGFCDYYSYGLARQAFGAAAAGWALLFQVLSWFNFYCLARSYSNSAEAVLATAALHYWGPYILPSKKVCHTPTNGEGALIGPEGAGGAGASREIVALSLAALCVAVRPTSAALWAVVGIFRLSMLRPKHWARYLLLTVLPPVATIVGASVCLDSYMYGAATFVPLNFLRFNVVEGNSRIFGEQAWHWNFTQGLPAVLGAALPAAIWGFWRPGAGAKRLGVLAVWFLVYHSASPHKEFRFLLPVLPIAHAYAGQAVAAWVRGREDERAPPEPRAAVSDGPEVSNVAQQSWRDPAMPRNESGEQGDKLARDGRGRVAIVVMLIVLHVPAAVYLSVWHQSGALSAVDSIARRARAVALASNRDGISVHFLMPCHSAPLHSHLHFASFRADLWSLDCSPTNRQILGGSESDMFQADPLTFLRRTYGTGTMQRAGPTRAPPDFAVMWSTHMERSGVREHLAGMGLETVEVVFNAHVNGDADCDDTHRSAVVLQRTSCTVGETCSAGNER